MIECFTVENYRSIHHAELDFRYPRMRARKGTVSQETYPFFDVKTKAKHQRLLPMLGIWGPNGSGKSNLFRALKTFCRILQTPSPRFASFYEPNRFNDEIAPTRFKISLYVKHQRVSTHLVYALAYDATGVLEESLTCDDVLLWDRQEMKLSSHDLALHNVNSPWLPLIRNSIHFIDLWNNEGNGYGKAILMLAEEAQVGEERFIEQLSEIVQRLDVSIHSLSVEHSVDAPPLLVTHHQGLKQRDVAFDFNEESDGTQRILYLVAELLISLTEGRLIVADEMDRSIHPILFRALVRMCKSRYHNQGLGQLCFSTHDVSLMDEAFIAPEEVVLVGKVGHETRIETFTTLNDTLSSVSLKRFRERYLEGWYQNIPYPSL